MKVITFSRVFPAYHPKRGQPTHFIEKVNKSLDPNKYGLIFGEETKAHFKGLGVDFSFDVYKNCKPKHHTIRAGHNWEVGEKFSPRVWGTDINPKSKRSGAYHSKQITIAPPVEIVKIFDFSISPTHYYVDNNSYSLKDEFDYEVISNISRNDGLDYEDLMGWFQWPKPFSGQILCWSKEVNYGQ